MGHGQPREQERKIHYIGLNRRAKDLIDTGNRHCVERGTRFWADNGQEETFERKLEIPPKAVPYKPFASVESMSAESFFFSHEFADGRTLYEELQTTHVATRRGQSIDSLQTMHILVFVALKEEHQLEDGGSQRVWIQDTLWIKEEMERELDRFR